MQHRKSTLATLYPQLTVICTHIYPQFPMGAMDVRCDGEIGMYTTQLIFVDVKYLVDFNILIATGKPYVVGFI
jgi:hypothetical protein